MSERSELVERSLDCALDRAKGRALANMDQWGLQDASTLILCMVEELGEVSREQIAIKLKAATDPAAAVEGAARLAVEALDLAALCFQLVVLTEICIGPEVAARLTEARREAAERDSTDYPGTCSSCPDGAWAGNAGDRRRECHYGIGAEALSAPGYAREIPKGDQPPAWCPRDLGPNEETQEIALMLERARLIALGAVPSDAEPESPDLSEAAGFALILYMLFGPNASKEIKDGGYIRFFTGGSSPGILEQTDKRLVRIEEKLGLAPISFVVGDEDDEPDGERPA